MQSDDLKLAQLKQKLSGVRRSAWKPIVQEGDGDLTASKFAGKPWLSADETWPTCPNCQKPMQLFLQLNLDKLPESLNGKFGNGLLQFFYCTSYDKPLCEVDCEAWEPFATTKLVRIIQPNTTPSEMDIPEIEDLFPAKLIVGWEQRDEYPGREEIELDNYTIDNKAFDIVYKRPRREDKLAGWPSWVQFPEYPNCPTCNREMNQFIFQIDSGDDNNNILYNWGDMGAAYLVQCPKHKEQAACLWQCH